MKKVMKKFKQSLSILLAVAMVVTMVPQNTLSVAAAEVETIEPTTEETGVETIPAETESAEASTETVQAETETTSVQEETETETVQTETESEEVIPEETVVEAQTEETNEIGEIAADGDSQVHNVTFAVDEAAVTVAGDSATTADADYTFTAKVNDGYENLVVAAYTTATYETENKTEVEVTKPADGSDVYTIAKDKITENITIVVSATKIVTETNYKVAFAITGATVTDVTDAENTKEITGTVEVPEGKSLSFTVKANENYTLNKVTSTVADGEPTDLTADDEGVYTITPEADMSVTVEAKEIAEYTVNFAADENATITDVTVNGEAATVENGKVVVKADSTVTFKVSVAELYKVAEVNANDVVLTAEDGVYTMEAVTADTEVTVATQLDETKCNTLEFAVDGHKASYTATVSGNTVSGNDLSAGKTFSAGDTELIANGTIGVGLNIASGYELDKVEVVVDKKATVIEETDGYYNVSFTDNKNATLKVYTSPVGTEAAKTVVFANSASHMDYKVTTSETVKLEAGKKHTYTVAEGTKYINFTVTATGNYEPVVTLSNGTTPEFTKGAAKNGKTPYTYSVAANLIAENETVKISETIENKNVTVSFVEDEVEITSASIGGKEVSADDGTYKVPYGATITFAVAAYDNCKITKAVTTAAGATKAKNEKVKANGFTFTVKATADSETVITSEALDTVVVYDNTDGEPMSAVKNAYTVEYNNYYEITVRHGEYRLATIKDVKVKAGNADAKTSVEENDEDIWTSAELHISKEDAGKKLTVSVTIADGENEKVLTTTLNVLPVIKKVTIAGVKSGKLSQTADTEKEYKITLDPKKAANSLAAEVTAVGETPTEADIEAAKKAVSANVIDGKLVIRTNTTEVKENVAVVKIYDVADSTTEAKSYVEGGTFAVSTTAPAWVNTKPSVALKSSDDTTLTLTLGAKNVETPVNGKVYYKVVVTPQTVEGTETPAAITEATANPVYVEKTADSQEIKVVVNSNDAGKGQAWKYDVKVTLVQTKDDTAITKENEESITAFKTAEGKEGTKNGLATKNPYYETKLKLKKGTTTVYTGQNDVLVATAQFGKNTTFTNITAKDVTYENQGIGGLNVTTDGNRIFVSAKPTNQTFTGKHTIEVVAEAPSSMEPAKATITVDVVRGIEGLYVTTPSYTLYKADKKAATLTAQVGYAQSDIPKTKKVTWSIVDVNGNAFDENDALYGMVTVKNGKVTVNKNYIVSENEADNQFKVKVEAADFEENKVTGVSGPITITSETAELGEVVIVRSRYDSELDGWYYDVVARSGSTLTADTVYNDSLQTVVLKKGVAEKDSYPSDELVSNVTFSSSNKALQINAYGQVTDITKQAKNVKITATANDGSKNKAVLDKLNVSYAETTELGLKVDLYDAKEDTYYEVSGPEQKEVEYNGTTNSMFELQVKQLTEDGWNELYGLTNYKLNVKGAKVIYSDPMNGWYTIVATGEKATITLTDKSKKGDAAVKVYTLKNKALSTNKAPKLKASGNLIAGDYDGAQTITYSLPTGKNAYDYKDKYAMVTVDRVEAEKAANWDRYREFEYYGDSLNGYMPVNENGTVDLWFGGEGYTYIPAGSYKLWFSFGTINEDGDFIADTKATAVTLKAVAPKTVKESFKFATSYKMSVKEGATVAFTGSGKGIALPSLYCKDIRNANVNGEENKFLDYFELTAGGKKLKLKAGVDASAIDKKDLTAYVDYRIATDTYYMKNTAKITVSFVDLTAKYAASNATVLEDTVTVADVTVTANKALANVGFAYVTDGDFGVTSVNGVVIRLTYNGEGRPTVSGNAAGKKHKVTMYVVPANSYYTTELTALKAAADAENATDEAKKAYTDAVQKYGVKVSTTITVKARDVAGKIAIAKKALIQKFSNENYAHGDQNYFVNVPFTKTVPCEITGVESSNELFSFGAFEGEDGNNYLSIAVNKPALAAAVEAGTVEYGATIKNVKATVKFADDAVEESFSFKLTLPNEAEMTYEEAVKAVEAAKADIEAAVVPDYWRGIDADGISDVTYGSGIWGVCGEIVNLVPADSDTAIIMTQWNSEAGTYEVNANDFTAPTSQTAGKLTVKARLTSTAPVEEGQQAPSTDITFDLTIPATGMEPKDVVAKLEAFVSANQNGYATNLTTQEEVAADLREAAGLASNLRLMVTYFEMDKATQESSGGLYVDFVITDIKYGAESYEMNVFFNIDKLKTTGEAVTAVQAAVSSDALAELVKSNDAETVKTAVLEAANAAVKADGYTVAYATTDDVSGNNAKAEDVFSFVPATYKEEGKVSFTLVITDAEGNELENTVKVDETVAKNTSLQTLKEAKADILSALETFEATNSTTADEVKAAAAKAVVNEAIALDYKTTKSDVSGNDVSGNDATEASFEIIEATVDADGKVKGTFVLTMGTETMEVAFEITIPKLA